MLRLRSIVAFLLLAVPVAPGGDLVDRIVVTVNGRPVLQSELSDEVRFEALMSGRAWRELTPADVQAALDRLINRELINEQARPGDTVSVDAAEVDRKIDDLKSEYTRKDAKEPWATAVARYGITDDIVRGQVAAELNEFRIVDARLRPSTLVDTEAIKAYYQKTLLPSLPPGQHLTLQQATPQIRELLIQQQINHSLESWLELLRGQAQIRRFDKAEEEVQKP